MSLSINKAFTCSSESLYEGITRTEARKRRECPSGRGSELQQKPLIRLKGTTLRSPPLDTPAHPLYNIPYMVYLMRYLPKAHRVLCMAVVVAALAITAAGTSHAFRGSFESGVSLYPDKEGVSSELRSRLKLEEKIVFSRTATFLAGCRFDGLYSDREEQANKVIPRLENLSLTLYLPHVDITMGYCTVYWGKLDQLPPVDVVNPLNMTSMFLKAERSAAKLPVPLLMVSPYFQDESRLDLLVVPYFKSSTWDELNESTSPFWPFSFNQPLEKRLPSHTVRNVEYGGRFSAASAGMDWSIYYFDGYQDLPVYRPDPGGNKVWAEYPRGDMFGFDCELTLGGWVVRGESAYQSNRGYMAKGMNGYVLGKSFTSGVGLFKRFRDNYLDFTFLRTSIDVEREIEEETDEISILTNLESRFSYETKITRLFFIYNVRAKSFFVRSSYSCNLTENTWIELAIGNFGGSAADAVSRLNKSDFFSVEYQYDF